MPSDSESGSRASSESSGRRGSVSSEASAESLGDSNQQHKLRHSASERDHKKTTPYSSSSDTGSTDSDTGSDDNESSDGQYSTDNAHGDTQKLLSEWPKQDKPSHHPLSSQPNVVVSAVVAGTATSSSMRGRYMPPSMRRQMMAAAVKTAGNSERAKAEVEQRESWEGLKKRVNGQINKVNTSNIKEIIVELFSANLIRGRGLFCRSAIRAQSLSRPFTPVYAALVAVVNTKLPIVGELLLTRLVLQFRRAFNRDEKDRSLSAVMFIAHLTNQRVAHEVLALQVLTLLLENPTDDSVEIAVAFMREVGALLAEIVPRVLNAVFDTFRSILHDADIDKRIQYMIEVLFQYRRDGFKDNPTIPDGLDLVELEEQIIHEVALDDDELDGQDELNVFKLDENFEENERKYDSIRSEILGDGDNSEGSGGESGGEESGTESDVESGSESDTESSDEDTEAIATLAKGALGTPATQKIHDLTETEMINLRRTIYLSVMSSLSFEEAAHKLLKIEIRPGEEQELCNMVIECCSQERTYKTFFGMIGERLCKVNRAWANGFSKAFESCYENIHRYETNHIRNIAHFFAHLLASDALKWSVLIAVVLTEEATTSSSRIFLKILLQDLAESLGLKALNSRLKSTDPTMSEAVKGMFPSDSAKSIRFAINYYTSIGLGAITEEMREWLKSAPTLTVGGSDSDSGSESDTDSGSSSSSGSYSRSGSGSSSGRSPGASPKKFKRVTDEAASLHSVEELTVLHVRSENTNSATKAEPTILNQDKPQTSHVRSPEKPKKHALSPSRSPKSPLYKRGRSASPEPVSPEYETKTAMRDLAITSQHFTSKIASSALKI
ncbi:pre-mRNA-splicing factor cwc22 [Coemansia sp. RSA 1646]|nr:pre-mRNA-splicing factor cwc22 [Coemansia sp. RSA 1646]